MGQIRDFLDTHYRHFNAREAREAAEGYIRHVDAGGKMLVTLAGAMSTGELGISLSEMIREEKVHGICCTGANLEEDIFNLVAGDEYMMLPQYRDLTPEQEGELLAGGWNRVTDCAIPETVMRSIDRAIFEHWKTAEKAGARGTPWDFMCELVRDDRIAQHYQRNPANSWVVTAQKHGVPVWCPGWEDSTLGNVFCSYVMRGMLAHHNTVKSGTEQLQDLAEWYGAQAREGVSVGFFQVGGGIAGDFSICVVPMLIQDCLKKDTPVWGYFCQISDAVTSYGGYSGAVPNEKITWGKLLPETPKYMIQSDASIVAPLVFAYVLDQ
jgi:deoxyhypusine synthase